MPAGDGGLFALPTVDAVTASRLLYSVIFVVVIYFLAMGLRRLVDERIEDRATRFALRRTVDYLAIAFGLLVLGIVWLERLGGFSVALGLLAAGAAFSAREAVTSLIGWLLITSGRSYKIGDRIEMAGIRGDVVGFGLLQTVVMEVGTWVRGDQYTGRIVTVSNAAVFQQPLYNYTRYFPYIWDEITVPVTFESNWQKARDIGLAAAREETMPILTEARAQFEQMARRYLVNPTDLEPQVYVTFNDNWIELGLRYVSEARRRRQTKDAISRKILLELTGAPDVETASQSFRVSLAEAKQLVRSLQPIDDKNGAP